MIKQCIACGINFDATTSARRCKECQAVYKKESRRRRAYDRAVRIGKIKEPGVGSGNSSKNKNRPLGIQTYRKASKNYCELCGKQKPDDHNPWEWCVHHKDRNRYNNSLDNLQTLCKSCHQKIHEADKHLNEAK